MKNYAKLSLPIAVLTTLNLLISTGFAATPANPYQPDIDSIVTADQTTSTNTSSMKSDLDQINTNTLNISGALISPATTTAPAMTAIGELDAIQNDLNSPSPEFDKMVPAVGLADQTGVVFGSNFWSADLDQLSNLSLPPTSLSFIPPQTSSNKSNPYVPSYTDWLVQWWENLCGDMNGPVYANFGNPVSTSDASNTGSTTPSTSVFNATCENALSSANANNIIPLVMPASNQTYTATPSSSTSASTGPSSSQTPAQQQAALLTQIQTLTPVSNNDTTAVQDYIDQLTSTPSIAQNSNANLPNALPEITLITGVLQAVSQDYQSGKMATIDTAVTVEDSPNSQTVLAKADVPDLLRILILEMAKSNQIQAMQLEQNQKNTVLSAAILADLVKLNQTNTVINNSITANLVNAIQSNGQIDQSILNQLQRSK